MPLYNCGSKARKHALRLEIPILLLKMYFLAKSFPTSEHVDKCTRNLMSVRNIVWQSHFHLFVSHSIKKGIYDLMGICIDYNVNESYGLALKRMCAVCSKHFAVGLEHRFCCVKKYCIVDKINIDSFINWIKLRKHTSLSVMNNGSFTTL